MNKTWPELILEDWQDTLATVHLWTQIVGKIRMKLTPLVNHWWNVTLYVSARGLTTAPKRYRDGIFDHEIDFVGHALRIECSDGATASVELKPQSVSAFYSAVMQALRDLGIEVAISTMP